MLLSPTKIIDHLLISFDVVVSFKPTDVIVVYYISCLYFISNYLVTMLLTDVIVTML